VISKDAGASGSTSNGGLFSDGRALTRMRQESLTTTEDHEDIQSDSP